MSECAFKIKNLEFCQDLMFMKLHIIPRQVIKLCIHDPFTLIKSFNFLFLHV